ncbi:MAG: HNH endonuclease, partial [Candidatus Moranbacteria bacterium]|nr:HNH endonuclease [Candidatus Moranbacteria bacterium]
MYNNDRKKLPKKQLRYKTCKKCNEKKSSKYFYKSPLTSDGLRSYCKKCDNSINNTWYENNREKKLSKNKEWCVANKSKRATKENSPIKFKEKSVTRTKIELYEEIKEDSNGILLCKCSYCGDWFPPSRRELHNRLYAIENITGGNQLYCSANCKTACPIFNKGYHLTKKKYTREVQPELRQLVLKRDNYTCQKCGNTKDFGKYPLHCHHIDPVINNPVESADIDNCITLCKICHIQAHKIPGCGNYELR